MAITKTKKISSRTHGKGTICSQQDAIENLLQNNKRLSEIITGNGDPSKGMSAKMAVIEEKVNRLTTIEEKLDNYHGQIEEYRTASMKANSAFEQYKASMQGEIRGESKASTKAQVSLTNWINVIGMLVLLIGLIYTILSGQRDKEVLKQKIDDLGTPVIINSRGLPARLPPGDSLKFFRDGEFKSTIKDSQEAKK